MTATVLLGAVAHAGSTVTPTLEDVSAPVLAALERYGISVFLIMAAVVFGWRMVPSWIKRNETQAELAEKTIAALEQFRTEQREQMALMHRLELRLGQGKEPEDET